MRIDQACWETCLKIMGHGSDSREWLQHRCNTQKHADNKVSNNREYTQTPTAILHGNVVQSNIVRSIACPFNNVPLAPTMNTTTLNSVPCRRRHHRAGNTGEQALVGWQTSSTTYLSPASSVSDVLQAVRGTNTGALGFSLLELTTCAGNDP